jgi:AAA domain
MAPTPRNKEPTAIWEIKDAQVVVHAEHVRFDRGDGKKDCYWRLPGAKNYGLEGRKLESLPLFGSEHATQWPEDIPFVVVAEGEPPTEALLDVYIPALGTVTGAKKTPGPEALEVLRGQRAILWPDNDEPGKEHMERLAAALQGIAAEVRILEWTEAPEKGDAADHPAVKSRKKSEIAELLKEMANARIWKPKEHEIHSDHPIESEFSQNELLPLKSAKDIVEAAKDGTDYIVEGLLAPGELTDLAGLAKHSGKTTFITHMVHASIEGKEFIGLPTRKAKWLLVTEQGNNFADALVKSGLVDAGDALRIVQQRDLDSGSSRWDKLIEAAIEVCKGDGFEVLVIDTFAGLSRLKGNEENQVGSILEKLAPLKAAAHKHNLAVLLARHAGKDGKGRGSSIFEGEADIVLTLGRPEGNHKKSVRVLEGIGRHDDIPSRITIELTEKGYVAIGSDDKIEFNKAVKAIRDVAPHNPNEAMTENEVLDAAAAQGTSRTTLRRAFEGLMEQDENPIKREGEGKKGSPYRYWQPSYEEPLD